MTANSGSPRCCVIIPVYRHLKPLARVLDKLENYNLLCILVDDGNDPPVMTALAAELSGRAWVKVLPLPAHGGKGVACVEGCRRAAEQGYTHAIFVDADDQHNIEDIPWILEQVRQHPQAMILGYPVFDESAPFERRRGRIVSNVWVWIETLSLEIKDSLCGFHCLPLGPVVEIASQTSLGKGMDFDPDVLVRLFWKGVPVISFKTRIQYPPDGTSNFHLLRDNALLFWLHTRLFFGSLLHWPSLLIHRYVSHSSPFKGEAR